MSSFPSFDNPFAGFAYALWMLLRGLFVSDAAYDPASFDPAQAPLASECRQSLEFVWVAETTARGRREVPDNSGRWWPVETTPILTGADIARARLEQPAPGGPDPVLMLRLTERATPILREQTAANIGRDLAILVDGRLMMAPRVQQTLGNGQVMLTIGADTPVRQLAWIQECLSLP